ncbi:MAG TPA: bifunctional UDP-N-acetylglucosamine diphosphorylase/glucosamine-1-phosphate N-acetyltransferase GlmU [Rhodobiaceae bacterium]|nr:MAG: Bifunctional protein GlmU [Rhodobiaceae bacterium UBA7378]HCQ82579.1 bifunctional UDP-N-acetylglucosamine diphosphorylase/glucosamine-1-phosphate N-acetyltransferase GlmU [Rhodobiaceae bacterium]
MSQPTAAPSTAIIILAAGKGTRMKSALPKVLHEVAGRPMLGHAIAAAAEAGANQICLVTAPEQHAVRAYALSEAPEIINCIQENQLGTGDAVRAAADAVSGVERVVVMFGDTPLMRADILTQLSMSDADVTVLGFEPDDAATYGRIVMDATAPARIVEFKDADAETRAVTLCNGGAMGVHTEVLSALLPLLGNDNAQNEYYLPDLVQLAVQSRKSTALVMGDVDDTLGVDSRAGLARAEARMQARLRAAMFDAGVTMQDPNTVYLSHDTVIEPDVRLEPNIKIGPGVHIAGGALIKAFSHLEGVTVGPRAIIGPFARLRPGTVLGADVRIGNFVETKNANIRDGSKVNHLSYIGDAELGLGVNIGAGTITCNYDGFKKHLTQIGDGAFIGSNSSLIAPVTIGAGAYLGSGTAVSSDVPKNGLTVTRAPRRDLKNWADNFRRQNQKED